MQHGIGKVFQQRADDVEARQLDFHHRRVAVDVAHRSLAADVEGVFLEIRQM